MLSSTDESLTAFAPTTDDNWLPGDPSDLAASNPVPLIIGTTRDEMHLFTAFDPHHTKIDEEAARITFERHFASSEAYDIYRDHRPGSTPPQLVSALETDGVFRWPAHRIAKHGNNRNTAPTPIGLPSKHRCSVAFSAAVMPLIFRLLSTTSTARALNFLPATPPLDANSLHRSQIR